MASANTVIEINGRKYDARTGKLLGYSTSTPKAASPTPRRITPQTSTPVIDGLSRRRPPIQVNIATQKATTTQSLPTPKKRSAPTSAAQSLDIRPGRPKIQRAKTLLRTVVKKPQKHSPQIHTTSMNAHSKVEHSATGRGMLTKRIPEGRISRASQTIKSATIHKFAPQGTSKKPVLSNTLTIASPPRETPQAPEAAPVITKPVLGDHAKKQVFDHPIAMATHHSAPKVKKQPIYVRAAKKVRINPRIVTAAAITCSFVLLVGFLAYQNVPAVAMRVAASRAGFGARLPGNPPAGFAIKGPIQADKGMVVVTFQSNTDNRSFAISQKPTDWTSESLLTNHVLSSKTRYQTYRDRGLTVFIYNNGNATWVNKGIWYSINGQGSLSSDQVLAIAGSI